MKFHRLDAQQKHGNNTFMTVTPLKIQHITRCTYGVILLTHIDQADRPEKIRNKLTLQPNQISSIGLGLLE